MNDGIQAQTVGNESLRCRASRSIPACVAGVVRAIRRYMEPAHSSASALSVRITVKQIGGEVLS